MRGMVYFNKNSGAQQTLYNEDTVNQPSEKQLEYQIRVLQSVSQNVGFSKGFTLQLKNNFGEIIKSNQP